MSDQGIRVKWQPDGSALVMSYDDRHDDLSSIVLSAEAMQKLRDAMLAMRDVEIKEPSYEE